MMRRELNPDTRVLDEKAGIVEYVASGQTIDAQNELIRADGWKFDRFSRNAPLVDSHKYGSLASVVGKVIDFRVVGRQLVETAQWAIDVAENQLARLGWAMTRAGYLKAVSVGFEPELVVTRMAQHHWPPEWAGARILPAESRPGRTAWAEQMNDLGIASGKQPDTIYVSQQQLELSACVIGSNPNALLRSYKAGLLTDADLEILCAEKMRREIANGTDGAVAVWLPQPRSRADFLVALGKSINKL